MYATLSALLLTVLLSAKAQASEFDLPQLNTIKLAMLEGSYSCDNTKSFGLGLSSLSRESQDFELALNYACGSKMEFESGFRGPSFSLIADMGKIPLESVNHYLALSPKWQVGESHNFRWSAYVVEGHSYSVIFNTEFVTGMMVFTVDKVQGDRVYIRYAVRRYQIHTLLAESPDFDYEAPNTIENPGLKGGHLQ